MLAIDAGVAPLSISPDRVLALQPTPVGDLKIDNAVSALSVDGDS